MMRLTRLAVAPRSTSTTKRLARRARSACSDEDPEVTATVPAVGGTRPSELLVHAQTVEAVTDVRRRLVRRHVVEGDSSLDVATRDAELVIADALDARAGGSRAEYDDALTPRLLLPPSDSIGPSARGGPTLPSVA